MVMIMEPEFSSLDELYKRVGPALDSKVRELRLHGYKYPDKKDIWNYLVKNTWKDKKNLLLHELVSDILYLDNYTINEYVLEKMSKDRKIEDGSLL